MADEKINTEGGGVVKGDVDTGGGDFAGRDKITTTSHTNRTETTFTTNLSGNVLVTIVAVLMLGIITVLAVFRDKSLESPINQSVGIVSTTSNQEKQVASISPSTAEPIQTLAEATSVKVDPSTAHQAAPTSVPTLIQQTVSIATPLSKSSSAKLPSPSDSDILGKAVKGKIETPGARDTYTFTAEAGQTLYFDVQAYHDSNGNTYGSSIAKPALYMELYPEGESRWILSKPLYGDVGRYTLPKTGKYLISIGNQNNDVTGTYSFRIKNVK